MSRLRELAEACELAYREYGQGRGPTDAMLEALEKYEQAVEQPELVLAYEDVVDAARRVRAPRRNREKLDAALARFDALTGKEES